MSNRPKGKQKYLRVGIIALSTVVLLTFAAVAQVEIELWHTVGGAEAIERYEAFTEAFEKTHPDIKLVAKYTPAVMGGSVSVTDVRKLMTAIAGGVAPDIARIDRFTVPSWVPTGTISPLDEYIEAAGMKKEDYWEYAWDEASFLGYTWALPTGVDSWELFYWNKDVFREAGLDPDKAPKYIEDLEAINDRIYQYDAKGNVTQVGFVPWIQCGHLVETGRAWAWGGEFYDAETLTVTADHPRNVIYWEWIAAQAKKYPVDQIQSLRKVFGKSPATRGFFTGKTAAIIDGTWVGPALKRYAPNLDYGVATAPYPKDGGRKDTSGGGGWSYMLPVGGEHPQEAFEVIKWLTSTVEAYKIAFEHGEGAYPAYKKAYNDPQIIEKYFSDDIAKVGLELMESPNHFYWPHFPGAATYWDELINVTDYVIHFQKTPEEALKDAGARVQATMNEALESLEEMGLI